MGWKKFVTLVGSVAGLLTAIALILSNLEGIRNSWHSLFAVKLEYGQVTWELSRQDSVSGNAIIAVHWVPASGKHPAGAPVITQAPIYIGALREKDREDSLFDSNTRLSTMAIPVSLQRTKNGQVWSEVKGMIWTDQGHDVAVSLAEQRAAALPEGRIVWEVVSEDQRSGKTTIEIRWEAPGRQPPPPEPLVVDAPILSGAHRITGNAAKFLDSGNRIWNLATSVDLQREKQGNVWTGIKGKIKTDRCPEVDVNLADLQVGTVVRRPPRFIDLNRVSRVPPAMRERLMRTQ